MSPSSNPSGPLSTAFGKVFGQLAGAIRSNQLASQRSRSGLTSRHAQVENRSFSCARRVLIRNLVWNISRIRVLVLIRRLVWTVDMPRIARKPEDNRFEERDNPQAKVWDVRPPPSVIDDLREVTRRRRKPDEWRWHCHSRPPAKSSAPVILAEGIIIPEHLRTRVGMAPCPLCSLRGPRYYEGMLAWWPEERALRVIGRERGAHIGEAISLRPLSSSRKRRDDDDALGLLIDALPSVPKWREWIAALLPRARELDRLRKQLLSIISRPVAREIYKHSDHRYSGLMRTEYVVATYSNGIRINGSDGEPMKRPEKSVEWSAPFGGREMLLAGEAHCRSLPSVGDFGSHPF